MIYKAVCKTNVRLTTNYIIMKLFMKFFGPLLMVAVVLSACGQSLVISRVDYSQAIESVLKPNEEGFVIDVQHGLKFNIMPLQYAETQDTSSVTTEVVRLIRGEKGFYYITAPGYNHVYVMAPEEGKLEVVQQIKVTENGIAQPAFNQRDEYIQLVNLETGESWMLTAEGVQKQSKTAQNEG